MECALMAVRTRKLALAEGIIAGTLFGTASIFIRFLQAMEIYSIVVWRLLIGCIVLSAVLFVRGKSLKFSFGRRSWGDFAVLGFFLGLHFIFFISAVKDTTILNATVLVNTTPIFSLLVSVMIFKIKPSKFALVGLATSFAGICVIAYAESLNIVIGASAPTLKGDFEAVLAAIVEAFYLNYGKKIRNQVNALTAMFPIYMLAAVIVGILGIFPAGKIVAIPNDAQSLFLLIGLGTIPTAIAHTLYFSSLSNLKSFETATMALLEPIGATILGIIFFQEIPAYPFVLGALLIFIGILFTVKEPEKKLKLQNKNKKAELR